MYKRQGERDALLAYVVSGLRPLEENRPASRIRPSARALRYFDATQRSLSASTASPPGGGASSLNETVLSERRRVAAADAARRRAFGRFSARGAVSPYDRRLAAAAARVAAGGGASGARPKSTPGRAGALEASAVGPDGDYYSSLAASRASARSEPAASFVRLGI